MTNESLQLGRKNVEREKETRERNSFLQQMETAALQSYKKDSQESPELSKAYNIHQNLFALPIKGTLMTDGKRNDTTRQGRGRCLNEQITVVNQPNDRVMWTFHYTAWRVGIP